ncbi:MAG: RluA family pseudouridine synthase [Myxococcales bacterium]
MRKVSVTVSAADVGERLDKFLAAHAGLSRGQCRRVIAEGGVWLEGRRIQRLSRPVAAGETFSLVVDPKPAGDLPEPRVLQDDRWLVALDKPPGLPTQGTLASADRNALAWAERRAGRPVFSVHRLDAGTSGILVVAKSREAARALAAAFREGRVRKVYLALASGRLPAASGTIDAPLVKGRTPGRWQVARGGQGLAAQTDYQVLRASGSLLLVEARPRTGRTHQIRVHFEHAGAPILGDGRYRGPSVVPLPDGGAAVAKRPMLHAASLELPHPKDGTPLRLAAPPPADFAAILASLGWTI